MGWFSTLTSHPEHVEAIGMISIEHGNMELYLGHLLAAIIDVPYDVGQGIFWVPQGAGPRRQIVEVAAKQMFKPRYENPTLRVEIEANQNNKEIVDAVVNLTERASKLTARRNSRVHDLWGTDNATGEASRSSTRSFVTNETHKIVPVNELTDIIRDLRTLIDDIQTETRRVRQKHDESKWWLKPQPQGTV